MLLRTSSNYRLTTKLTMFMDFAWSLGKLSTCKRMGCGALILDDKFRQIYAIGYNGQPAGASNHGCTGEQGKCGCVHGELNAIIKLHITSPCIMICTTSPCLHCAQAIVNADQIDQVIWDKEYRSLDGLKLIESVGRQHDNIREWCSTYRAPE